MTRQENEDISKGEKVTNATRQQLIAQHDALIDVYNTTESAAVLAEIGDLEMLLLFDSDRPLHQLCGEEDCLVCSTD